MLSPMAGVSLGGIDEDEFSILLGDDGECGLVDGGNAVPHLDPLPIDDDHALGGSEIAVPVPSRRVREAGSGEQRRSHDARVGAYQQRLDILRISACQLDEASCPVRFREFAAIPAGHPAALMGKQPDLEELEGVLVAIVLGMTYARSGTYDLDVAGYGPTDIADAVFVRDDAFAGIPKILETPKLKAEDGRDWDAINLETLRSLL